jgi:hypothetical protein
VRDGDRDDDELLVFDLAENAIIPHAATPESR